MYIPNRRQQLGALYICGTYAAYDICGVWHMRIAYARICGVCHMLGAVLVTSPSLIWQHSKHWVSHICIGLIALQLSVVCTKLNPTSCRCVKLKCCQRSHLWSNTKSINIWFHHLSDCWCGVRFFHSLGTRSSHPWRVQQFELHCATVVFECAILSLDVCADYPMRIFTLIFVG